MVTALRNQKALIAKVGMDAHWRGAIVIANALRDAGMEVVYLGHATARDIVAAVEQEDPVLVGISTLSGNHVTEVPSVVAALADAGIHDVAVVAGGAIPATDIGTLTGAGVAAVFPTGTPLTAILDRIGEIVVDVARRRAVQP